MINDIMEKYNIKNYRYYIKDKLLIIHQSIRVKTYIKLRYELYVAGLVEDIIIKNG